MIVGDAAKQPYDWGAYGSRETAMTHWIALDSFDAECEALSQVLDKVKLEDWKLPTNCPPWNLHELVVHIMFSIGVSRLEVTEPEGPTSSAADYFRRPERDTSEYKGENVDRTQSVAAGVELGTAARGFKHAWKTASNTFSAHDPEQRIGLFGRQYTLDSFLLTRLMAVATHGVDVALSLSLPAWTTPIALRALRPVLVDLLTSEPPSIWSEQDFLEFGSGRRSLRYVDRGALGDLAERFPLLS